MKYLAVPLEVRELRAEGREGDFTGHASVFGNVDSYNTIIDAGAFKRTLKAQKGNIPITFFHMPWMGIGMSNSSEDNTGLAVEGHLNIENSRDAAEVYAGMPDPSGENPAAGYYSQMSHGFDVVQQKKDSDGIWHYTEVKLYEVAILMTNFAANPEANIDDVRSKIGVLQMALRGGSASDIRKMIETTRSALDEEQTEADDLGIIVIKNSDQVRDLIKRLNTFTALFDADPDKSTLLGDSQPRRSFDSQSHSKLTNELRSILNQT